MQGFAVNNTWDGQRMGCACIRWTRSPAHPAHNPNCAGLAGTAGSLSNPWAYGPIFGIEKPVYWFNVSYINILRHILVMAPFCLAPPALAAEDVLCATARKLEAFVAESTAYAPFVTCPDIGLSLPVVGAAVRSQAGAYLPATGRIELAPDLDLTSPLGQSYLLHELVHAAQYRHGIDRRVACVGVLEAEAYAVQAAFLLRAGLSRDASSMQIVAAQIGHCGADSYGG